MLDNSVDNLMIEILSKVGHDINQPLPESEKRINWDDIANSDKTPYLEILDMNILYKFNTVLPQIINTCFRLPKPRYQIPRLLSFLSCYSLAMGNYPIASFVGKAGSGKSAMGSFYCDLYGGKYPFNPSGSDITQAAMKRKITATKYEYPDSKLGPRGSMLYFDDLSPSLLNDLILTLLKRGITKGSTIEIADKEGIGVISFAIDCPKAFSSIHKIWEYPQYQELKRRILVFNFDHIENLSSEDLSYYDDYEFLPTDSIDFSGLSEDFKKFWHDEDILEKYKSYKRSLSRVKHDIPKQLFTLSLDVMATGLLCEYYSTTKECLDDFKEYWSNHYEKSDNEIINLLKVYCGDKTEISPNHLMGYLSKKAQLSQCEKIGFRDLKMLMNELNYELTFNPVYGENIWYKK